MLLALLLLLEDRILSIAIIPLYPIFFHKYPPKIDVRLDRIGSRRIRVRLDRIRVSRIG